jgi:hypothetical protein
MAKVGGIQKRVVTVQGKVRNGMLGKLGCVLGARKG